MQRIFQVQSDRSDELAVLNKQLIEDEGHNNPMGVTELSARMKSWLDSDYSSHVLEVDGEILAYSLWRDDGEYYYIRHLFTRRDSRRKGHARSLLHYLEEEVFTDKPIRLEVLAWNVEGLSFYEQLGYSCYCHTLIKHSTSN